MNNNIGVAVLDTGIYKHIDFGNRIIAFKDFINNRAFPYDDSGHGTHVSGIIAGDGYASHGRFKGIQYKNSKYFLWHYPQSLQYF